MNWSKRKGTTGKIEPSPQFLAEEKFTFQRVISSYASPGQYIFSFKGSKIVPIKGVDDKRQITATFAVSLTQIFLRIQLIYTGTTPRSLPKYDFSVSFFVVFTDADKSIGFFFFFFKWNHSLFIYKHTGKLGWSSICVRFSQFQPEIMLDGILNFKTHFMAWYCVWYEHCNGLFNIRNLVSRLILMFVRICFCDAILYTWFGKKWKPLKKFWGWKICLVYAYFLKHLSLSMLISFMLI